MPLELSESMYITKHFEIRSLDDTQIHCEIESLLDPARITSDISGHGGRFDVVQMRNDVKMCSQILQRGLPCQGLEEPQAPLQLL